MTERTRAEEIVVRCHRRLGRWYLQTLMAATVVLAIAVNLPVENISQVPLWTDGDLSAWWYAFAFIIPSVVVGPLVLICTLVPRHRALFRAQRGEAVDPVELWHAAVTRVPLTTLLATLGWGIGIAIPGVAWLTYQEHLGLTAYLGVWAGQMLLVCGSGGFYFMVYELAFLPFARQAAAQLPPGFISETGLTVRRRLWLLTTSITFTIGCEASGFALAYDERHVRLWAIALTTIALVVSYAGLPLALVSFSVTRRVNELANAMHSVGRGPTAVHVYPSSGDEFDAVGRALNRTVDLLDEHAQSLRESRRRLVAVADGTRRQAERDLHDGAQQHLAIVSMKLALLARRAGNRPEVIDAAERMRAELAEALEHLRELAHGIYPAALDHEGLVGALDVAAYRTGVPVVVEVEDGHGRWSRDVETALYFCCWELIQVVARGGHDAPVRLSLTERDGVGSFALSAPVRSFVHDDATPLYLQDRIGAVGGEVSVDAIDQMLVATGRVPVS